MLSYNTSIFLMSFETLINIKTYKQIRKDFAKKIASLMNESHYNLSRMWLDIVEEVKVKLEKNKKDLADHDDYRDQSKQSVDRELSQFSVTNRRISTVTCIYIYIYLFYLSIRSKEIKVKC